MGIWVIEGTPTTSFVLYTINVECMCDASYVTLKYRQYRRYHVIFARKYKILQNVQNIDILGARFNSSETPLFASILLEFPLLWTDVISFGALAITIPFLNKY